MTLPRGTRALGALYGSGALKASRALATGIRRYSSRKALNGSSRDARGYCAIGSRRTECRGPSFEPSKQLAVWPGAFGAGFEFTNVNISLEVIDNTLYNRYENYAKKTISDNRTII